MWRGPFHEKCIGSLIVCQSPPQHHPASVHASTNHSGMSVTSTLSARYGFVEVLMSIATPTAWKDRYRLGGTVAGRNPPTSPVRIS